MLRNRTVIRSLATVAGGISAPESVYKVVILGGGSAGMAVASQLSAHASFNKKKDILIVEPSETHYYQPLWTLVGAGLKTLQESGRPMASLIPPGVFQWVIKASWFKQSVKKVDPAKNTITTADGTRIKYDYLVLATGIQINWNKISGLQESLGKNGISSNYDVNSVEKTNENIRAFKGGRAIFTQPATPIKCAGAPQKIMYLAEDHFRFNGIINIIKGIRDKSSVEFYSGLPKIFAIEKYGSALLDVCKRRDIKLNLQHDLVAVRPEKKQAIFKNLVQNGEEVIVDYDMLHVTPPMGPPEFVKESGISDAVGWVEVDKETTQHLKFKNIFALGDVSSLPTSKTAAGVTTKNLLSVMENKPLTAVYDGYTSCPLITKQNGLILAEFSGYTGKPLETFHYDQSKESKFAYFLKESVIPKIYWNMMMKGEWTGPGPFRPFFNPLGRN